MKRAVFIVLLLLPILPAVVQAQDSLVSTYGYARKDVGSVRPAISVILVGTTVGVLAVDDYVTWWRDVQKPFTWFYDGWFNGGQLGLDKVGHMFGAYAMFKGVDNGLLWGGADPSTAFWWAVGISAFNGFGIEMGDAFSPYGFDPIDLTFDFLGTGYGILQYEVPFFRSFNFKFTYWSNFGARTPANFVEDYDALTIWLTADVHHLLPQSVNACWPSWLQLAFGYGVSDNISRRKFVIGLDFNFEGIAPCNDDMLLGERVLDAIHIPAPAVKFPEGQSPIWSGANLR